MTNASKHWLAVGIMLACATGASAQVGGTPGGRDGHYVGIGVGVNKGFTLCPKLNVSGFRVSGGQVQYRNFRGSIGANGYVSIPYRGAWLTGRFEGTEFHGEIEQKSSLAARGSACAHSLSLKLEGS